MPSIKQIEVIHVNLPTRREHKWTGLTESIGGYILARMESDTHAVGWGEAPALKDWGGDYGRYFGESPGTTKFVVESYLAPAVKGCEVGNIADLHQRMDAAVKGYPYAKAALDIAAYDLAGRTLGMPVWQLLGGKVRDRVPVTHSIGLLDIQDAVEECKKVVGEGFHTIKIKVGVDPKRDIEIVSQIRRAVGEGIDLCVDANCGYPTPRDAIQILRKMEPFGLKYAEQPVEGIDRMAEVTQNLETPVMADESAWLPRDVLEIFERRAADIVSIYTTKPGGLYGAMEVAATARAAKFLCNVNGSVETGVGNLANIHLAAAAIPVTLSCVVPVSTPAEVQNEKVGGIYYNDDLISEAFQMVDGCIVVPEGPGFGIEVDEEKVKKYRNT